MKFRFPIVIIDEDFRSENTSGLGIRALADAMEKEGMEVLGVTSYGDLSQFAQQQSRASAFILSIDDEEFGEGTDEESDIALKPLRAFVEEIRYKNADIPIYLYGETRTSRHIPNDIFVNCTASFTCLKTRRSSSHAILSVRPSHTSMVCLHRFSAPWCIMQTTALTLGIALDTQVA